MCDSVVVSQMFLCDVTSSSSPPPLIFHLTVSCRGLCDTNVQYFLDILALLLIFISDLDFESLFPQLSDSIIQLYWRQNILWINVLIDMMKSELYFVSAM